MARQYTLRRRAEKQAQTRRRIVEAAVDLHGSIGPARTTMSMVAERAGVQRHTLYAHFPDEWSLLLACSGLALERDPLPDPAAWRTITDPAERLRIGLAEIYGWYGRTAGLTGCVLRDAAAHEGTRRIAEFRMGPTVRAWREILGENRTVLQRAVLDVALGYHAWRTLTQDAGLDVAQAVDAMARSVEAA